MSDQQIDYWIFAAGIILPYLAAGLIRWRRRTQEIRAPVSKRPNTYVALRNQILNSQRSAVTQPTLQKPDGPWAVVMDWGVASGIATVVAVSDGTASIYYTSGGGLIGGSYARQAIREAALHAVSISGKFLDHMRRTSDFPLPETGGLAFYVLTDRGVFTARASVELMSTNRHPLAELGNAMQSIITQNRIMEFSPN